MTAVLVTYHNQTVVIGAGVIGLACAAALANSGREVLVLEKNQLIGEEVSSRNSEVIHGGIYYRPGSLRARLCVQGKHQLYQYCASRQIATQAVGKLIVATSEQDVTTLEKLQVRGKQNGVDDLELLSAREVNQMEPTLRCYSALYSPSTGIVDSHGLMLGLQGDLESMGGAISFSTKVASIESTNSTLSVTVLSENNSFRIIAEEVVNCAGHGAVGIANSILGTRVDSLPKAWMTKGNYFRLKGKAPFSHLIYPAPEDGGLGVHLALDMAGNARFGPDVEKVDIETANLVVEARRAEKFYDRIRRYWPALTDNSLVPDYAGLRPKISRSGKPVLDFEILDQSDHDIPGMVHCLGIESPGLTSSLAIGDEVVARLS